MSHPPAASCGSNTDGGALPVSVLRDKTSLTHAHNLAASLHRSMEARWPLFLTLFSVCYWVATGLYSAWRVMWYDELFTYYTSNLPTPAAIWQALAAGADLHPPAHYWFSYLSQAMLGSGEFGLRVPAITGFWVLSLCVFFFVKQRTDALHGSIAMLLLFATGAQLSRLDARPYPIVLGCSALALLCWQLCAESRRRRIALVGLALSLFVAIMSHYYALFLLPALALGEWIRLRKRGKADLAVWFALAAGASALPLLLPIIASSSTFAEHFARTLSGGDLVQVYVELLGGTVPLLLVGLGAMALGGPRPPSGALPEVNSGPVLPSEETAACLGLLAIPIPAFLLARFVTEAWAARYVGPAVVGFCILIAVTLYGRIRRSHGNLVAGVLFAVLAGWFLWQQISLVRLSRGISYAEDQLAELGDFSTHGDLPVVMPHGSQYLPLAHYWPKPLASRLYYLTDRGAALRYRRTAMGGHALARFAQWVPLNVVPYRSFVENHPRFLVFGSVGWVLPKLIEDGARVELKGFAAGLRVYEAEFRPPLTRSRRLLPRIRALKPEACAKYHSQLASRRDTFVQITDRIGSWKQRVHKLLRGPGR